MQTIACLVTDTMVQDRPWTGGQGNVLLPVIADAMLDAMEKVSPSSGSDGTAVLDSDSSFVHEMEQKDTVERIQVPSQGSFVEATAKATCEIIKSNVNNFTESLLSGVPYEDYQQLKAETSEEIARISESIAQSISSMKEQLLPSSTLSLR